MELVETICLRCGYPVSVPDHLYNWVKTCRQRRTPEEEKRLAAAIKKYKKGAE